MRLFFAAVWLLLTGCVTSVPEELPVVERTEPVVWSSRPPVLKADYVAEVLGEPALKRRETPSEMWVYAAKTCVLFVYFNADGEVKHMDIGEPSNKAPHQGRECLIMAGKLR